VVVKKNSVHAVANVLLPGADGARHSLRSALGDHLCLAVVFTSVHCPYAKAYFQVLEKLAKSKAGRNAAFLLVASNRSEPRYPEGLITLRRRFGNYSLPLVRDTDHTLANALQPTTTPSAFVLTPDWRVAYAGAIDDRFRAPGEFHEGARGHWPWDGSRKWVARRHYLAEAIRAVATGTTATPRSPEVGCAIHL
jgi:hypothetical protein